MPSSHVASDPAVSLVLAPRDRRVGGFTIRRTLPHARRRMVGPFIFFDHFGPVDIPAGVDADVRPHPHIGLATITALFEGRSVHRDSLGFCQEIRPGEINLMVAGRGIAHSERTPEHLRDRARRMHGLQLWVALPAALEEDPPSFAHHPAETLPRVPLDGGSAAVWVGEAWGRCSPVEAPSDTLYVEIGLRAGATVAVPAAAERAVYVVEGSVRVGETALDAGHMAVVADGASPSIAVEADARLVVIGGEPLDGPRHIWWNFVSSRPERIEEAKRRWKEGRFDPIPGDDDVIPLPDA